MRSNNPTMRDVAKMAGVSIQTVSAIINGKPGITNETKERVLSAIQTLGYRPFTVARSLRTRQTNTIGLVVSDIANPVFSSLAGTVEDIVHLQGYSLIVYNTHNDPDREKSVIQAITERWVDGVLFVSTGDELTGLDSLKNSGIPVVAIDRIPRNYDGPAVVLDNDRAGALAAQHLIDLGHRKIAHIRGPQRLRLAREREVGFHRVLSQHGLGTVCPDSEATSWGCESGYASMNEILMCAPDVTGVFAANDRLAIGAIRAISEHGLGVPGDVSVIGVDDIEVSAYQNPPLTTIRQSTTELGIQSIAILMEIIQGDQDNARQVLTEPTLIVRQSTAAPRQ